MDQPRQARRYALSLAALVLLGLVLRIASAQGGLWLDEAWSAQMAADAGTPLGVFLKINHDNNHHLNSLWLQFVGFGAAPWLARALSIVSGTLAITAAARIVRPRGDAFGLVAALVFAVSPMLVTMGSEARGYAPMSLALLIAVLLVGEWLAGRPGERARLRLALCFGLGALSQLTMVFGCVALVGWAFAYRLRHEAPRRVAGETLRFFAPALLALAAVIALVAGAALASPEGFRFGHYEAFAWLMFLHALVEMTGYTSGFPLNSIWLLAAALVLVVLARHAGSPRLWLYRLAAVGFPAALALLRLGNPGHPRYYLVAGIALLLLAGEMIGAGLGRGGWQRWAAIAALGLFTAGSLVQDADLIANQRGQPDGAVPVMAALAPAGAVVLVDRTTATAMLRYGAARYRYPLTVIEQGCRAARFLFVDRFKGEDFPARVDRCGRRYHPIAGARAHGLSGTHWTLYAG